MRSLAWFYQEGGLQRLLVRRSILEVLEVFRLTDILNGWRIGIIQLDMMMFGAILK